jgi:hypothetical protein
MPHSSGAFRGEEIAARRLEEIQNGLVFERGRVRNIHDDLGAGESFGQSLTGDGVDAGCGRGRDCLMAVLAKSFDQLSSDEAATPDYHDLH